MAISLLRFCFIQHLIVLIKKLFSIPPSPLTYNRNIELLELT